MKNYKVIRITDRPQLKNSLAKWFSEKWQLPKTAYLESMNNCLKGNKAVPAWYCVLDDDLIIGGMGVIENDFHNRKDLSPNICAVYVQEKYRGLGIAGKMLDFVCEDMKNRGVSTLYLLTDHIGFYEKYNWQFLCMVQGDCEEKLTRMYIHKQA